MDDYPLLHVHDPPSIKLSRVRVQRWCCVTYCQPFQTEDTDATQRWLFDIKNNIQINKLTYKTKTLIFMYNIHMLCRAQANIHSGAIFGTNCADKQACSSSQFGALTFLSIWPWPRLHSLVSVRYIWPLYFWVFISCRSVNNNLRIR
jgi:hypothetical protein